MNRAVLRVVTDTHSTQQLLQNHTLSPMKSISPSCCPYRKFLLELLQQGGSGQHRTHPKLSRKLEDKMVMGSEPRGKVKVREGPLKKESRRAGTPLSRVRGPGQGTAPSLCILWAAPFPRGLPCDTPAPTQDA